MPDNNETKPKISWVKQLYFYLILGGSILALSFASFAFLRANLTRFVFTEVDDYSYTYFSDAKCSVLNNGPAYDPSGKVIENTIQQNSTLRDECTTKAKNRQYQNDMLNSLLTIIIAGVVLGTHLRFFKLKD
jgi:hypothetical protein